MITCPNKNLKDWKNLVKVQGEAQSYILWDFYEGNVPEEYYKVEESVEKNVNNLSEKPLLFIINKFLKEFDFNIEEYTKDSKETEESTIDLINRIVYIDKNNIPVDIKEQFANFLIFFLQHNSEFVELRNKYSKEDIKKYFIKAMESSDKSIFRKLIEYVIDLFNSKKRLLENYAIDIISRVEDNDTTVLDYYGGIRPGSTTESKLSSFKENINKDKTAKDIIYAFSNDFHLTGSIALGEQGTVFTSDINPFHDIDYEVNMSKEEMEKIIFEKFPNSQFVRSIEGETYLTQTYIILPEGYKAINLDIRKKEKNNKVYTELYAYDVIDSNNNIVGKYEMRKQLTGKTTYLGNPEKRRIERHTGFTGKSVDFFLQKNPVTFFQKDYGDIKVKFTPALNILKAKLDFMRPKDVHDILLFKEYRNQYNLVDTQPQQITSSLGLSFQDIEDVSNFIINKLEKVKNTYNPRAKFIPAHRDFFGKYPDSYGKTETFKNKIKDIKEIFKSLVGYREQLQENDREKIYDEIEFLIHNKIEDYWREQIQTLNTTVFPIQQKLQETYYNLNLLSRFFRKLKNITGTVTDLIEEYSEDDKKSLQKLLPKLINNDLGKFKSTKQQIVFTEKSILKRLEDKLKEYKNEVKLENVKKSAIIKKYNTLLNYSDIIPDWKERLIQYVYDYEKNIISSEHSLSQKIKEKNEKLSENFEDNSIFIDKSLKEILHKKLLEYGKSEKDGVLNLNTINLSKYFNNISFSDDILSQTTANEVLSKIENIHPEYKQIIDILKPFSSKYNVKIELIYDTQANYSGINSRISEITDEQNDKGAYKVNLSNAIKINMASNSVRETPHKTLLHEIIHSFSNIAIIVDPQLDKFINKVIDKLNKESGNNSLASSLGMGIYGLSNSDEFIAEFFSNKNFQDYLKNIKPIESESFKNAFSEIVNKIFTTIQDILNKIFNKTDKISNNLYEQLQPLLENIFSYQDAMMSEGIYTEKESSNLNKNSTQLHISQQIKLGIEDVFESNSELGNPDAFRNMEIPDTNLRNLEKKLGFRKQDGSPVTFKTRSEAQALIGLKNTDEYKQQYNFIISPAIGYKKINGFNIKSYDFFKVEITNKYNSTIIDNIYGEIDKEEAKVIIDNLLPQDKELTSKDVFSSLMESDLIDSDIKELLKLFEDIDVPIEFVENESNELMSTNGKVIRINKTNLDKAHPKLVAEGLIHEFVHIKTVNALENPQSKAEKFLLARVKYVFNMFKQADKEGRYGGTDEIEFVAELLAKKEFRDYVKKLENGNLWQRIFNAIREFLRIGISSTKLISELEKHISRNNTTIKPFGRRNAILNEIKETKDVLKNTIRAIDTRIKVIEKNIAHLGEKAEFKTALETNKNLLETLRENLGKEQYLEGLTDYLKVITEQSAKFKDSINSIRERVEGGARNTVFYEGSKLRSLGNYAFGHSELLKQIREHLYMMKRDYPDRKDEIDKLGYSAFQIEESINELKNDYLDLAKVAFAKFLLPFGMGRNLEHLMKVMSEPGKDIGFFTRWLDNLQESGDELLGLIDVALKNYHTEAMIESQEFEKTLLELKKKLEDAGIKNTDFMTALHNDKATHYFVTEIDIEEFRAQEAAFAKTLPDPETAEDPDSVREANNKKWGAWFKKNGVLSDRYTPEAYEEFLLQKEEELGGNYKAWLEANTIYNPYLKQRIIPHTRNKQYQGIMSNKLMSEYYWLVLNNKMRFESHLPDSKRHLRRKPQMRKDYLEILKEGNFKQAWNKARENFQIMEDDASYGVNYGLTNERGQVVQFLPIYYVDKLKNVDELTNDVTSAMILYAYDKIKRNKLSTIVDLMEIGKEIVYNRGVLETSSKGKLLKIISKSTGEKEELEKKENTSRIYERLEDYLNMFVYGAMKEEGFNTPFGNSEKLLDNLGKYTALRTLALNVYAVLANNNVGEAIIAMEALQKSYFNGKGWGFAEKTLDLNLLGVMGDSGARLKENKLSLWTEYMDSLNNYEEHIFGTEAERKTKLSQSMKLGSTFALSRMVEFRLHNKVSLALADSYRFDTDKKRFAFEKEFFKEVEDLKNKKALLLKEIRQEINNKNQELLKEKLTKDEIKQQLKPLYEKYDKINSEFDKNNNLELIKSKEKELRDKWNKMTNFWDAHEVKNHRLVIKDEFKNVHTIEDKSRFINKQHGVNSTIQGMYSKLDKNALQKMAIGRLGMMYRKWIKPAINRRFIGKYTDFEKEMEVEGYWRTFGRFMNDNLLDLRRGAFSMSRNWNNLTDAEKNNFKRCIADTLFLLSIYAVGVVLKGLGEDDDKDWALNMTAYQINRLATEYGSLHPMFTVKEGLKILRDPIASFNTVQEIYNMVASNPLNWFDEIEKGKYKDLYVIQKNIIRTVPPLETVYSVFYPEEKLKYFTMN